MRAWRNWYTRTIEVRMEQSVEVQVLSRAQGNSRKGIFAYHAKLTLCTNNPLANTFMQHCLL